MAPDMVPHGGTHPNCHGERRKPASTQSTRSAVHIATADHVPCAVVQTEQNGRGRFGVGEQIHGLGPEETGLGQLLCSWHDASCSGFSFNGASPPARLTHRSPVTQLVNREETSGAVLCRAKAPLLSPGRFGDAGGALLPWI